VTLIVKTAEDEHLGGNNLNGYFPLILNNITNGIIVLDRELGIVYWNKAQEQSCGITLDQVRGKNIIRLFPQLKESELERDFQVALNGERILRERFPYRMSDGSVGYADRENMPLRDERGRIIGILSQITEVTEKVNLERKLLWAQKFEDLGHMAAGLAHELNNLFAILMAQADLAKMNSDAGDNAEIIRTAHKIACAGGDLTRQLLNFAKKPDASKEPADLKEVVDGCIRLLKGVLACENIEMDAELTDVSIITINASQLQQLIFNLVLNAKNAMKDGGILKIRLMEKRNRIRVAISDNGPGIPPDLLKNIFEPFVTFSIDNKRVGTGLGLSICRDIVHNHGGEIKVRSRPGLGTTFIITLPKY
jgi:PAS domain S-box-containing protein